MYPAQPNDKPMIQLAMQDPRLGSGAAFKLLTASAVGFTLQGASAAEHGLVPR